MNTNGEGNVKEPLEPWLERIIDRALLKHAAQCPVRDRVTKLEIRVASFIAFMAGSGLLGGVTGAMLVKSVPWS